MKKNAHQGIQEAQSVGHAKTKRHSPDRAAQAIREGGILFLNLLWRNHSRSRSIHALWHNVGMRLSRAGGTGVGRNIPHSTSRNITETNIGELRRRFPNKESSQRDSSVGLPRAAQRQAAPARNPGPLPSTSRRNARSASCFSR